MSRKSTEIESPTVSLKNESARQRWDMFHRAIAHAKQSNYEAQLEPECRAGDSNSSGPLLSVVR